MKNIFNKDPKKLLLVVDDEPAVCNMLKKFLDKKGYNTTIVLSGEDALKKINKEKFFAIFLDIRMPGLNGIETLKRIKEKDKEVNVVMITALDDEETGKKCIELGAYDYITKPLSLEYLENVLTVKMLGFEKKLGGRKWQKKIN